MSSILGRLDLFIHLLTNRSPIWAAIIGLLVGWAICPVYMYVLAVVVEWRWPRYRDQFRAFMPGNVFLGMVFGSAAYLYAAYIQTGATWAFFSSSIWNQAPTVAAALIVVSMCGIDVLGTIKTPRGSATAYSWGQLVSWCKIWHNVFVYGAYGYLLIKVGIPGLVAAPVLSLGCFVARCILVGCLARWVYYLVCDAKHPKHATGHVSLSPVQWVFGYAVVASTLELVARCMGK